MDKLKQIGMKEFLTVPLWVWSIVLAIWIIGLAISMPAIWIGLEKNADQIPLMVGSFGALFLGTVGLLGLYVNYHRTRVFERQLKTQREQLKDQRDSDRRRDQQQLYATNVQHLGSSSESVRIGAIYGLERLAKESIDSDEPWASKVARILCAHIRITTTREGYLEREEAKSSQKLTRLSNIFPANEITIILEVLTKGDDNPFDSTEFDLKGVHLRNVIIENANLMGSQLLGSNLNGALFDVADLSGAILNGADLSDADLLNVNLTGAYLKNVKLTGTQLREAKLEGSYSGALSALEVTYMELEGRVGELADLKGCKFGDGKLTDLRGVSCGVLTQGLYDAIMEDYGTGNTENEDQYRAKYSAKRKPTEEEKEQLVGKDNVDKCKWGDIYVLEE